MNKLETMTLIETLRNLRRAVPRDEGGLSRIQIVIANEVNAVIDLLLASVPAPAEVIPRDEALALDLLNQIYDAKIMEREAVVVRWIAKIRGEALALPSQDRA